MSNHSKTLWFRTYRQRIADGLERCRGCGRGEDPRNWLTFDHLVPKARGRTLTLDNATILCEDCQHDKADQLWPHLVSLADEEARAPREQRWSLLAQVAAFRASTSHFVVRRDVDGAAVSILNHRILRLVCVRCSLAPDTALVAFGCDVEGLADHMRAHRAAGDRVPDWAFEDIPATPDTAR